MNRRDIYFCLILLLTIFISSKPRIMGYDSISRFQALQFLVDHENSSLSFNRNKGILEGANDHSVTLKYNASLGLAALPLYWLGKVSVSLVSPQQQQKHLQSSVAHFNHILLFIFLIWVFKLTRRRFGLTQQDSWLVVLLILFASMALPHTRDFYSEFAWSFCALYCMDQLSLCFHPSSNSPYRPYKLGLASALLIWLSTALTPVYVLTVFASYCYFIRNKTTHGFDIKLFFKNIFHSGVLLPATGTVLGISIYCAENFIKRGHILDNGYLGEPFILAPMNYIYLIFSPGKGLLWFMPSLMFGFILLKNKNLMAQTPSTRPLVFSWYIFFLGLFSLYGSWSSWGGAVYWGPRFFLLPSLFSTFIFAYLFTIRRQFDWLLRTGLYLILTYSVVLNKIGVTIAQRYFKECQKPTPEACHLSWSESPFYVFSRPIDEWEYLINHRSTLSICFIALFYMLLFVKRKQFQPIS